MRTLIAAMLLLAACTADDVPSDELDAGQDASVAHELSGDWSASSECISQATFPCTEWVGIERAYVVINMLANQSGMGSNSLSNTTASVTWTGADMRVAQSGPVSFDANQNVFCVSIPAEPSGPSNAYALCQDRTNPNVLKGDVSFSDNSVRRFTLTKQ